VKRWGPVAAAALAGLVCYAAGWRGTDWAAQLYRANAVARSGLVVWDPGWYGGNFPLGYSVLLPLAGAYLGLWPVALIAASGASFFFDRLLVQRQACSVRLPRTSSGFRQAFLRTASKQSALEAAPPPSSASGGRSLASWYFAASTVVEVAIGQLPTLAGEALALGSVLCLRQVTRGRLWPRPPQLALAALLGLAAAITAPLDGVFLALSLAAWAVADFADRGSRPGLAVTKLALAAGVAVASGAAPLGFPVPGWFPFPAGDFTVVVLICAFCSGPWAPRPIRIGAAFYGAASVLLFVVPNQAGGNDTRLAAYVGAPLVLQYMPAAWRWAGRALAGLGSAGEGGTARGGFAVLAAAGAAAVVVWQWAPMSEALAGAANGRSSVAAFYRPLLKEIRALSKGDAVRVEVVPLAHHWEAAYVAEQFAIARGWERQLDLAYDPLFYQHGPLAPSSYRAWLLSEGVSYVALARAPLDYAGEAEAALLRSGPVPGLRLAWRSPAWDIWEVSGSLGLATPPAAVESLQDSRAIVRFSRAGISVVKIRWSRYWTIPPALHNWVCVSEAPDGWVKLSAARKGVVVLSVSLLAPRHGECPAPPARAVAPPMGQRPGVPSKGRHMSDG